MGLDWRIIKDRLEKLVCRISRGNPSIDHEDSEREKYSFTISLFYELDESGWLTPRPGRFAPGEKTRYLMYHSPPSSSAIMEEYSYTSTHPLGHAGPVTGKFTFDFTYCTGGWVGP